VSGLVGAGVALGGASVGVAVRGGCVAVTDGEALGDVDGDGDGEGLADGAATC
jgi:hypothetical protein